MTLGRAVFSDLGAAGTEPDVVNAAEREAVFFEIEVKRQ